MVQIGMFISFAFNHLIEFFFLLNRKKISGIFDVVYAAYKKIICFSMLEIIVGNRVQYVPAFKYKG